MRDRQNQAPDRRLVKTASAAGLGTTLALALDKLLSGLVSKLGQQLADRIAPSLPAVVANFYVPLTAVFRLHALIAFGASAWLLHCAASRIRWQLTLYFACLVFYYWEPGFGSGTAIPFSMSPGAASKDCLFMIMSAALVLSVPTRDKLLGLLESIAAAVLLTVGSVAILGGHSDEIAHTVSLLGMLSAAWIGASMWRRVSWPSLVAWGIYTFALAYRVDVWNGNDESFGMHAYYWAMFLRVPALIELALLEERAGRREPRPEADDDADPGCDDTQNQRLAL